jgi:hypothetical protein
MMNKALWTAGILATVLACTAPAEAGEGLVTKVRNRTLAIDKGADDGLEVGLEVSVIRPPDEAIIHPLTGENLGAPEIEIGMGKISKVSARAASVQLEQAPIITIRPGDVARFVTLEEMMVMEQEMATETAEQAAKERGEIRSQSSRLARNIGSIQGSIRALEGTIRDLRRYHTDTAQPQFNAINKKILAMQEELRELKVTVTALNTIELQDITEGGVDGEPTPEQIERWRLLIQEEIDKLDVQLAQVQALPTEGVDPEDLGMDPDMTGMEEEKQIFQELWFWGLLGAIGLGGVAFWMYTRLAGESDEDEEDDEDDELDDEDDELDDEEEEEDSSTRWPWPACGCR